ncbi:MAG: DUF3365 domain-containing protein [Jannaschia sp.]
MTRSALSFVLAAALAATPVTMALAQDQAADEAALLETGHRLADLLRAGRAVVSSKQPLINDADLGAKGITPDSFVEEVVAVYADRTGAPPVTPGMDPRDVVLVEAFLDAMRDVIVDAQPLIDREGMAFKGFIPATFARLTNERFDAAKAGVAGVKVTAPPHLVRNRMARPDPWESAVIAEHLDAPGWSRGEAFHEIVDESGTPAFRMLIPEYYSESCMSCHGGPAGDTDITGFPKEGAAPGDLGGAISITLRR